MGGFRLLSVGEYFQQTNNYLSNKKFKGPKFQTLLNAQLIAFF